MTQTTFREAYGVLQRHAETLRTQREPNIDGLLAIVTESVEAFKVCKSRIDAVEQALEHALGGAEVDQAEAATVSAATGAGQVSSAAQDAGDLDDDIPF